MRLPLKKADTSGGLACRTILDGSHDAAATFAGDNRTGRHAVMQALDTENTLVTSLTFAAVGR
jgi:hypothetical protein